MNKLKLFLTLLLLLTTFTLAQNTYTLTLAAGQTITAAQKLDRNQIPSAIYTDSLTTASTISFYVYFGDTTGTTSSDWYLITAYGDSAVYTVQLKAKRFTTLDPKVFYAAISDPYLYSNKKEQTWIWIKSTAQTYIKNFKLRTTYY